MAFPSQLRSIVAASAFLVSLWFTEVPGTSADTYRLPGLNKTAEILIDKWGVPHIYAKTRHDAYFAQGFNAARDRLFQIDLWRRRGLGRLAEAFGPAYVEQDMAARLFLYRGDMQSEWKIYGRDAEEIATAFVKGINAFIDWLGGHPDRMPFEFKLLKYKPARWAAEDVVRIRSHGLTRNLSSEVARAGVACKADLKSDDIRVGLTPAWEATKPQGLDLCLPAELLKVFQLATRNVRLTKETLQASKAERPLVAEDRGVEGMEGSNNWVIAPRKSATGRAIMANDPHRAYSAPSLRYIAHLVAPGLNVIGAGEPAIPGVSTGHNDRVAFGITIFPIDQEDLYVYRLNPDNPNEYRYEDQWQPFQVIREAIAVRDSQPVETELKFTRHGPLIYVEQEKQRAFAVRTCWLEAGMSPYFSSIDYVRAQNFSEFKQAVMHWGAPTLNQVYADVEGNIGWLACGRSPIRPNWDGLLPVPGDGRYEWAGFWPGDRLPSIFNPEQGWFATANQMNLPPDYPYKEIKLGFEWTNPARYQRIAEVISKSEKMTLQDSMRLQNDVLSIPARRLVALLRPLSSTDRRIQAALELLRNWDFEERSDSAQAALVEVWLTRHLGAAFKKAILSGQAAEAISSPDLEVMLNILERPAARFPEKSAAWRDQILLDSLESAYAEMVTLGGPDPGQWQWGRLHHSLIEHPFAAVVDDATRSKVNVGPLPKHGSPNTPNQSAYRLSDFRQTNGPSFRIVVDVGNWDNSRAINTPGQSGDPDSAHYRDLAPMWLKGEYFPLLYSRKAIERATEVRLRLLPR